MSMLMYVQPPVVPDVVGMTQADAEQTLSDAGYNVAVNSAYSETVDSGDVISSDPVAGTQLARGSTVTILVSLGTIYASGEEVGILAGGRGSAAVYLETWAFQPNVWTSKTDMPSKVHYHPGSSQQGSKVYVYYGLFGGSFLNFNREYSPNLDTWDIKNNAAAPARNDVAGESAGGLSYAMLGKISGGYSNDNDQYNATSDTWANKANVSWSARLPAATNLNSKIHLLMGLYTTGHYGNHARYNHGANTWTARATPPLGSGRSGHAYITLGSLGWLYYGAEDDGFGGEYIHTREAISYNYSTNGWAHSNYGPHPYRTYVDAFSLDGKGYIVGGYGPEGSESWLRDVDRHTPNSTWTSLADHPETNGIGRHTMTSATM